MTLSQASEPVKISSQQQRHSQLKSLLRLRICPSQEIDHICTARDSIKGHKRGRGGTGGEVRKKQKPEYFPMLGSVSQVSASTLLRVFAKQQTATWGCFSSSVFLQETSENEDICLCYFHSTNVRRYEQGTMTLWFQGKSENGKLIFSPNEPQRCFHISLRESLLKGPPGFFQPEYLCMVSMSV